MSLDELKTQNIRTVTEKALVCFIKNGITNTKVSEDLPSAPFTAIFRQKATLLLPRPSAIGSAPRNT